MIYDAAEVGLMSIYYGGYSGSRRLINMMIYDSGNAPSWQLSPVLPTEATIDSLVLARIDDVYWFWPMEATIGLFDFAQDGIYRRFCP